MVPSTGLPLREVARRTGLSLPTIRRHLRSGRIRAVLRRGPFGRQWEVSEEEVARYQAGVEVLEPSVMDPGQQARQEDPNRERARGGRGGLDRSDLRSSRDHHGRDDRSDQPDQCDQPDPSEPMDGGAGREPRGKAAPLEPFSGRAEGEPEAWRLREEIAYWRGRWQELREVLPHLSQAMDPRPPVSAQEEELESCREALRVRSQELAQARNLVDRLRREKARLEEEVQALRARARSLEPTLSEGAPAPGRPRFMG